MVCLTKLNNKKNTSDFFNDAISKLNLHKHKNSSESKFYQSLMNYLKKYNYRDFYGKEERRIVEYLFKKEIDHFGYKFNSFTSN